MSSYNCLWFWEKISQTWEKVHSSWGTNLKDAKLKIEELGYRTILGYLDKRPVDPPKLGGYTREQLMSVAEKWDPSTRLATVDSMPERLKRVVVAMFLEEDGTKHYHDGRIVRAALNDLRTYGEFQYV